jgi:predicted phage tail protein
LERKRQRDLESQKLHEEMMKQFEEVKKDLNEKTQKAIDALSREFKGFSQALKEGSADIYQKLEIEKHLRQLGELLSRSSSKSKEKYDLIAEKMKSEMAEYETELKSEPVTLSNKEKTEDVGALIAIAEQDYPIVKK